MSVLKFVSSQYSCSVFNQDVFNTMGALTFRTGDKHKVTTVKY